MQRTTQRRIKLLDLSVAGSLVKEILVPDVTLSADKTKLIARLVLRQKGKIYWPIFQLAELVFFMASTMRNWPHCTGPEEDYVAVLVDILANKFCPFAVVPALQSICFFLMYVLTNARLGPSSQSISEV